jgi:hypothetical protein
VIGEDDHDGFDLLVDDELAQVIQLEHALHRFFTLAHRRSWSGIFPRSAEAIFWPAVQPKWALSTGFNPDAGRRY